MREWRGYHIFKTFEKRYGSQKAAAIVDTLEASYFERGGLDRLFHEWMSMINWGLEDEDIFEFFRAKAELLG